MAFDATVAFRGNRYSVPHGLAGATLRLRHRLGSERSRDRWRPAGVLLAVHRLAPPVPGRSCAMGSIAPGSKQAVLSAFTSARPCERKGQPPTGTRRPARGGRGCCAGLRPARSSSTWPAMPSCVEAAR